MCYDLYLGLGSYHYWKSARGGLLRFFRILKNEKDKGIRELYLAADSSVLSQELARSALIWIWLDKKEYDSVMAIAGEFIQKYPDGKSFLWPFAAASHKYENYTQALETYKKLRERIEENPGNLYNLIECDYHICRSLEKLGRKTDARNHARKFEEYYDIISRDIRKRQRKNITYMRRLAGG
jgi:tetratricopeptide (TPR) repeat protein